MIKREAVALGKTSETRMIAARREFIIHQHLKAKCYGGSPNE